MSLSPSEVGYSATLSDDVTGVCRIPVPFGTYILRLGLQIELSHTTWSFYLPQIEKVLSHSQSHNIKHGVQKNSEAINPCGGGGSYSLLGESDSTVPNTQRMTDRSDRRRAKRKEGRGGNWHRCSSSKAGPYQHYNTDLCWPL